MNIVLITDDFYPKLGGVSNVLINLCKGFREKGHLVYIFNPFSKMKNVYDVLDINKYNLRALASFLTKKDFYTHLLYSIWKLINDNRTNLLERIKLVLYILTKPKILIKIVNNISRLIPFLKKINFDIIIAGNSGWILPLVFILSRIFSKKIVSMAYGNDFLISNTLSLKTFYFKNVDQVIVITNEMKKIIRKMHHLSEKQINVINVGVNIQNLKVEQNKSELRKKYNLLNSDFIMLSVGRHVPRKKFDLVIRAAAKIKEIRPSMSFKYYLIGEGRDTPKLKKLITELRLEKQIKLLGSCYIDTRNQYYKLSDLFLMPSITEKDNIEGFGIVFLEANYFELPVIGSATGGMVEAIIEGETGFLIEPDDIDDLVEKILYLYDNKDKARIIGKTGFKRVIDCFIWDKIIEEYIRTFQNLLNK